MPVGSNRQRTVSRLKIGADGSIAGQMEVEARGMYAAMMRSGFRQVTDEQRKEMVTGYFKRIGRDASGAIQWEDPKPLLDSHRYEVQFEVKDVLPVPGAFQVQPMFFSPGGVAGFAAQATNEVEPFDTACGSGHAEEEYTYEFAEGLKVLAVPPNISVSDDVLSYEASYELQDNLLKVRRVLDDRTPGPICTPEFNARYGELMKKVLANVKAQVVYGTQ